MSTQCFSERNARARPPALPSRFSVLPPSSAASADEAQCTVEACLQPPQLALLGAVHTPELRAWLAGGGDPGLRTAGVASRAGDQTTESPVIGARLGARHTRLHAAAGGGR